MEEAYKTINDFEREPVPKEVRKGWLPMATVWFAIGIDLSGMLLGAQLGAGIPFVEALLAVAVGSLFLGVLGAICANIGAATGLSTTMISNFVFGAAGAKVISVVISISMIGWFGVQAGFFAENTVSVVEHLTGWALPLPATAFVGGLLMMTTAFAFRWFEKLTNWTSPLLVVLILAALVLAFTQRDASAVLAPVEAKFSFGVAVSLVVGIYVLGTILSPDISRWAKSKKDAMIAAFLGFFFGNSFMVVIAVLLSKLLNTEDLAQVFILLGLSLPALIVLTFSQWTTNTNNLYSASLSMSVLIPKAKRPVLTLVMGIAASALAFIGIFDHFITFLSLMTMLIAPVGGVYAAEYYVVDKQKFSFQALHSRKLIGRSLAVWLVTSLFCWLTTPAPDGLGLLVFTTIPALDGFIVAFVLQALIGKAVFARKNR
ncbi:cytosine permease [Shouchella clausii]|uniref:cytosine permease n=1 Tax=Shouchella clausii TaxID=79880 RepID=UPI00280BF133|nr:cytosine permease [Shouchella clausii]WMM30697.1 cytosine permease [Shouchella clausii]